MSMDFGALRSFLDGITLERLPACEMIVTRAGERVFAYGVKRGRQYLAYSLTKPVTCAAALLLVEDGTLELNERLSTYLPEYRDMRVSETLPTGEKRVRPARREIELRDLFTMTAGFGYDLTALFDAPAREAVRSLAQKPLLFDPGTRWEYSLCHDVLGAVIEEVTGKRLRDFARERVFAPLGMKDTCFMGELTDTSRVAPLYKVGSRAPMPLDRRFSPGRAYDSGGAGLVTTAEDYAAFCAALCGGRLLSKSALSLMTADWLPETARKDFNWPQLRGYGYGLGVRVLTDRVKGGSLSPAGEFGWGGVSGAYSLMDRSNDLTVTFLTHVLGTSEVWLYPRLRNLVYSCATK